MGQGRKQSLEHEDFLAMRAKIRELVPAAALASLVDRTLAEMREVLGSKEVAAGWSGGKDSIVLFDLYAQLGHRRCVLVKTNLEFPRFLEWVTSHMPPELDVVNTGQDLEWLAANPEMLFPANSTLAAKWFHCVQHRGQERYYRENRLDMLVLGRRKDDGNYVGENGLYTTSKGITRYAPLRDWSQEHVLAYLHYNSLPLPPIYNWPRGFRVGTGPWPARQWCKSVDQGWTETWTIDQSIVRAAAELLPSAREFLDSRGRE